MKLVEIRSFRLKPGTATGFHDVFVHQAVPLVVAAGIDVVGFGPCVGEMDAYYLIRCFDDPGHRQAAEDAFYSSEGWCQGPKEAVLGSFEARTDAVLWLSETGVAELRHASHEEAPREGEAEPVSQTR